MGLAAAPTQPRFQHPLCPGLPGGQPEQSGRSPPRTPRPGHDGPISLAGICSALQCSWLVCFRVAGACVTPEYCLTTACLSPKEKLATSLSLPLSVALPLSLCLSPSHPALPKCEFACCRTLSQFVLDDACLLLREQAVGQDGAAGLWQTCTSHLLLLGNDFRLIAR